MEVLQMDYNMTAVPVTAPMYGGGSGGFGGMGWEGLIFGLLLGGGGGLLGNRGDTAIAANTAGQISGLEASISNMQNSMSDAAISNQIGTLSNNILTSLVSTNAAIDANARTTQSQIGDLATAQAAANYTNLVNVNGLGRDITAQNYNQSLINLNSFNQLNTSMLQGFNEIGRDAANYANQLVMGQNALAAQLSSCCCSIEKSIRDDGAVTRALINDIRVSDLQTQLTDAKLQISNGNQTAVLLAALRGQPVVV
jgi:hypothetical protein